MRLKGRKKHQALIFILLLFFGSLLLLLRRQPAEKPPEPRPEVEEVIKPEKKKQPLYRIAVIIDDVGYPSSSFQKYQQFAGRLSFSVLPFLELSEQHAKILHDSGFEILLHIPMEPLGYPEADPGQNALFTFDSKQQVVSKINLMIDENPYAVGANNHMGSKATQDCELMGWVMDTIRQRNLFFIDSLTVGTSCAYTNAIERRVPAARRDVFLDNEDDFSSIRAQFEELKRVARANGSAIGIGHIQKVHTIEVLQHQLPLLEAEGFTLVFASEAVLN